MALKKNDLLKILLEVSDILKEITKFSPENPMDIERVALSSHLNKTVLKDCSDMLEDLILANKEPNLQLLETNYSYFSNNIKKELEEAKSKLNKIGASTPQKTW